MGYRKSLANPVYERAKSYADQGKFKTCIPAVAELLSTTGRMTLPVPGGSTSIWRMCLCSGFRAGMKAGNASSMGHARASGQSGSGPLLGAHRVGILAGPHRPIRINTDWDVVTRLEGFDILR
ncbi:MAG: hypothetical protein U5N26_01885 [Candidatus Marinimicrobia bacterium]|nr:hypothetical protein [Candidatus Neomarinimicrobiota bacterium]